MLPGGRPLFIAGLVKPGIYVELVDVVEGAVAAIVVTIELVSTFGDVVVVIIVGINCAGELSPIAPDETNTKHYLTNTKISKEKNNKKKTEITRK